MKKIKRYLIILLTLCMILSNTSFVISAVDNIDDENSIIDETDNMNDEDELQPTMSARCANDYNHIFGNSEHNLGPFLSDYNGDQAAAYAAVQTAAQIYVTNHEITGIINRYNQITVSVNGYPITVRGNVINGTLHIGTFFII